MFCNSGNPQVDFSGHFFTFGRAGSKWPGVHGGDQAGPDLVTLASVNTGTQDQDMSTPDNSANINAFKSSLGKYCVTSAPNFFVATAPPPPL